MDVIPQTDSVLRCCTVYPQVLAKLVQMCAEAETRFAVSPVSSEYCPQHIIDLAAVNHNAIDRNITVVGMWSDEWLEASTLSGVSPLCSVSAHSNSFRLSSTALRVLLAKARRVYVPTFDGAPMLSRSAIHLCDRVVAA